MFAKFGDAGKGLRNIRKVCRIGLLYVASMSQVWRIGAVNITKQRQMLLNDKNFQLALKLTNISDESDLEKQQKINSIKMLYALDLFDNKNYTESMDIFLELNTDPSEVSKLFPQLTHKGPKPGDDPSVPKSSNSSSEREILALIEYLTKLRQKIKVDNAKENDKDPKREDIESFLKKNDLLFETIDTTLLKCYLLTNDAVVAPLIRLNKCKLDESEQVLLQHKKFSELIVLYQTKGLHMKALQLLKDQAKQPDSSLKGINKTKNYLQQLGQEHINLIFQFSNWVLKEEPEEGLKIFTEDISKVEKLPRHTVLDFLLIEHESLVLPYLEHVVYVWNDKTTLMHDSLIKMLRKKILDKSGGLTNSQKEHMRSKLLALLEKSESYTKETILVHFPFDSLFEERAAVLAKLNNHEQVLYIYVHVLGDVQHAIKYCETVTERAELTKKDQEVFIILIRMLIDTSKENIPKGPLNQIARHPNTVKPDLETPLQLLEKHGDKIEPLKVLSLLPDSVPISSIQRFLEGAIHKKISDRRKIQVLKNLLHAEKVHVQELKMIHESQSVLIADYNVCPVCKKRFANQSAFVRYPNGDIVHYSCHDKNIKY